MTTYLVRIASSKIYGDESQPYDARGVHSETDEFRLVKVLWYFPGLNGIHGAYCNENHIVQLREQKRHILDLAF